MNIFVLDTDPRRAAAYVCDKHAVKMPLETAQILCAILDRYGVDTPYRPTHRNHPCTLWAGANQANFDWLIAHGLALAGEYTARYGKRHASGSVILWAAHYSHILPSGDRTPFAQALPEDLRNPDDAVAAYRAYYMRDKRDIATWKHSETPAWWV